MNEARRRYVNLRSIGMSVFNKKEDADQEPVGKKAAEPTAGKGRPTPKRKDAQAQNLRPLVPKDREASRKAAKARMRERENAEYDAMQKGDINHMPKSERLPWRIYIRDYVDARFNLGEFFIPVAFVILIGSIFVTYKWPALALPLPPCGPASGSPYAAVGASPPYGVPPSGWLKGFGPGSGC